jgi:hypothetical protein
LTSIQGNSPAGYGEPAGDNRDVIYLLFGGVVALGLLGLVALPAFEPVVPLCIASGYFFSSAEHCASLCIALGDMPWQRCIVA